MGGVERYTLPPLPRVHRSAPTGRKPRLLTCGGPLAHHDDALAAVLDDALHIAEESRPLLHRPMKVGVHGLERDAHSFAFLAVSITCTPLRFGNL